MLWFFKLTCPHLSLLAFSWWICFKRIFTFWKNLYFCKHAFNFVEVDHIFQISVWNCKIELQERLSWKVLFSLINSENKQKNLHDVLWYNEEVECRAWVSLLKHWLKWFGWSMSSKVEISFHLHTFLQSGHLKKKCRCQHWKHAEINKRLYFRHGKLHFVVRKHSIGLTTKEQCFRLTEKRNICWRVK